MIGVNYIVIASIYCVLALVLFVTFCGELARWSPALDLLNEIQLWTTVAVVFATAVALATLDIKLIVACVLVVLLLLIRIARFLKSSAPKGNASEIFRIVTFNLERGEQTRRRLLAYLCSTSADVVVLQEIEPGEAGALLTPLRSVYPHIRLGTAAVGQKSVAILSRWSWEESEDILRTSQRPSVVRSRIKYFGALIDIIGIHMAYPLHPRDQQRHFDWLTRYVRSCPGPVIVAGDFNSTPFSERMRSFTRATGLRRHATWQFTWPGRVLPPIFGIDNVLSTKEARTVAVSAGPPLGSDHLPLVVDLGIEIERVEN